MTTRQKKARDKIIENGGTISGKELKEIGYSDAMAINPAKVINSKAIREALHEKLKEHDITIDKVLKPIGKALEAKTKHKIGEVVTDNGDGSSSVEYVYADEDNLPLQLSASDRAVKLMGLDKVHDNPDNVKGVITDPATVKKAIEEGNTVTLTQAVFN